VSNAPAFEHNVAVGASIGIIYHGFYYYLPGETHQNFTERFDNTTALLQCLVEQSGVPRETANDDEKRNNATDN
jgi:hypothetical protein